MTLEQAIKELKKEYERAKGNPFVRDPLAFALFYTWKAADLGMSVDRVRGEKDNG